MYPGWQHTLYRQETWVPTHKPFPQHRGEQYWVPGVTSIRISAPTLVPGPSL